MAAGACREVPGLGPGVCPGGLTSLGRGRELKLEETLRRAGHTYREVSDRSALHASLASGQFNIVLVDFSDAADLQRGLETSRSRVVLVPVAHKLTKAEAREAATQCRFLINPPIRPAQYLQTIARAVASRSAPPGTE